MKKAIFCFLAVLLFASCASIYRPGEKAPQPAEAPLPPHLQPLSQSLELLHKSYVEPLTLDELSEKAMRGLFSELDEDSEFMNESEYKASCSSFLAVPEKSLGLFSLDQADGSILVQYPLPDSAAFHAGLRIGDLITKINNQTPTEYFAHPDYNPDAPLTLEVERFSATNFTTTLSAKVHQRNDIIVARRDSDGIGYLQLSQFSKHTERDLREALKKLDAASLRGLILDLRWNGGGELAGAYAVASLFLPQGAGITDFRVRAGSQLIKNRRRPLHPTLRLALLVNGETASAAELLTAALADNRRALVLGSRTFGKGSAQEIYTLKEPKFCAVKFTIAHFFTPNGNCIHKNGILPHVNIRASLEEDNFYLIDRIAKAFPELLPPAMPPFLSNLKDEAFDTARAWLLSDAPPPPAPEAPRSNTPTFK